MSEFRHMTTSVPTSVPSSPVIVDYQLVFMYISPQHLYISMALLYQATS